MKTKLYFIIVALFLTVATTAQPPQKFKYQGVARDSSGNPFVQKNISLKITLHQGSDTGTAVYVETHNTTTNQFGLFNVNVGVGTPVTGNFSTIQWDKYDYYQETEIDTAGGSNFKSMGTSQFLSVPYSLYSLKADTALHTKIKAGDGIKISNDTIINTNASKAGAAFFAVGGSNFNLASNSTAILPFPQTLYDDGNNFSDTVFTAPDSGYYHFDASVNWVITYTGVSTVQYCIISTTLWFNSSQYGLLEVAHQKSGDDIPLGGGKDICHNLSVTLKMQAGEKVYVEVQDYSSNAPANLSGKRGISGFRIY